MKSIFTYPNNAGTEYIDPNYVGDATSGFYKRVDDLRTGSYKAWQGITPPATTNQLMNTVSKFKSAFEESWGEVTFYQMWEEPMVTVQTELIESSISDATVGSLVDVTINFSGNHGFYEDQLMLLSGFDGSLAELNGQEFYVNKIDADTIKLTKTTGGDPIQLFQGFSGDITSIQNASASTGQSIINITMTAGTINNGDSVTFANVDGSWASLLNGNTFYAEVLGATQIRLHDNALLNNEISIYDLANGFITSSVAGSPVVFNHSGIPFTEDMLVNVGSFDGTFGDRYNGQNLYIQNYTGTTFNLSTDAAGTNLIDLPSSINGIDLQSVSLNSDNTVDVQLSHDTFTYLDGSQLVYNDDFDTNPSQSIVVSSSPYAPVGVRGADGLSYDGSRSAMFWHEQDGSTMNHKLKIYVNDGNDNWSEEFSETTLSVSGEGTPTGASAQIEFSPSGDTMVLMYSIIYAGVSHRNYEIYTRSGSTWTNIQTIAHELDYQVNYHRNMSMSDDTYNLLLKLNDGLFASPDPGLFTLYTRPNKSSTFSATTFTATKYSGVISGDGNTIAFANSNNTSIDIHVYNSGWNATPDYTITDGATTNFGWGIDLNYDGDRLVLTDGNPVASVQVYDFTGSAWVYHSTTLNGVYKVDMQSAAWVRITSNNEYISAYGTRAWLDTNGNYNYPVEFANTTNWIDENGHGIAESINATAELDFFTITEQQFSAYDYLTSNVVYLKLLQNFGTYSTYQLYSDSGLTAPETWQGNVAIPANTYSATATANITNIPYVNSTTGYVIEIDQTGPNYTAIDFPVATTTGDFWQGGLVLGAHVVGILGDPTIPSTTGTLTISTSETARYRLVGGAPFVASGGNTTFMQRTGESTYVPNPAVHTSYAISPYGYTNFEVWPSAFTIYADTNGYITGTDPVNSEFPGQINADDGILLQFYTVADTYVAPTYTLAEQQDFWDMDTEWDTQGFDTAKEWPHQAAGNVTPKTAKLIYNQPSSVTASQNGTKYVRSLGFQKWELEVEYPPLTEEEFKLLHVTAQNARGQYTPFYFINRDASGNPLVLDYHKAGIQTTARVKDTTAIGDREILLEGYPSFQTGAITKGELMVTAQEANGNITTMMTDVNSNAYGEARVKIPYALGNITSSGDTVFFEPYHFVVTLSEDAFEYDIDTFGFYYVKVRFNLDEWK